METIVQYLKLEEAITNDEYTELLNQTGLPKIASSYLTFNTKDIRSYLLALVARVLKKDPKYKEYSALTESFILQPPGNENYITANIQVAKKVKGIIFTRNTDKITLRSLWEETKVNEFISRPPIHVLESIIKAKDVFDDLWIATVNTSLVTEPLLLGTFNNSRSTRYLIDYWGIDINVSQINMR